ncbi:MAG: PRC-barrel domain-containing protein [Candidatus Thorarchaeota archaeon]
MEINQSICCRKLKRADVLDLKEKKIGHIGDMVFKFDGELKLSKFVLSGPLSEELMEVLRIKKDSDPIFDASMIKRLGEKVQLTAEKSSLKTTRDKDAIGANEIRFSNLEKLEIIDKHGEKVGKAIDVDFDKEGTASLIVGGGFFEEKLEAIGFKKDVDIIVPSEVIAKIDNKICLKVAKEDLALTMEEELKMSSAKKARSDIVVHRDVSRVRLFSHRPL